MLITSCGIAFSLWVYGFNMGTRDDGTGFFPLGSDSVTSALRFMARCSELTLHRLLQFTLWVLPLTRCASRCDDPDDPNPSFVFFLVDTVEHLQVSCWENEMGCQYSASQIAWK